MADAAGTDAWDIGLIGAEPARAEKIAFTAAYCEIEATYLVPENSPFKTAAEVDQAGVRISVKRGTAYDLWLERNIKHATVLRSDTADGPINQFVAEKLEAMASLRPALLEDVKKVPGTKILARQLYRGAAGDRHQQEQHAPVPRFCATLSPRPKAQAWWRA